MPKVKRPYSRVYWEALDDPKFEHVWDDDHALSAWLRLLVSADMAWPASATLYDGVRRASLRKLCDVGLVDMQTGGRYRIHGLDKERQERSDVARESVSTRYARSTPVVRPYPDTDYDRTTEGLLAKQSKAKTSKDEQSKSNSAPADDAYDVMLLVETLTRRPFSYREGHQVHDTLSGDVAAHGADRIAAEYRAFHERQTGPVDAAQLVFGVHNALHPLVKVKPMTDAERKEAEIASFVEQANRAAAS